MFPEEISRQLIDSGAKIIVGLATMQKELEEAVKLSQKPIKIIYAKSSQDDVMPTNGIIFSELTENGTKKYQI